MMATSIMLNAKPTTILCFSLVALQVVSGGGGVTWADEFEEVNGWWTYQASIVAEEGRAKVVAEEGKGYGYVAKFFEVDVDRFPVIEIKANRLDFTLRLELDNTEEVYTFFEGEMVADDAVRHYYREDTPWHGQTKIKVRLDVLEGEPTFFDYLRFVEAPAERFREEVRPHPRLFFTADELHAWRDRLTAPPYRDMWKRAEADLEKQLAPESGLGESDDPYSFHEWLAAMALAYSLTGEAKYATAAAQLMRRTCELREWKTWPCLILQSLATAYDCLFNYLQREPDLRERVRAALVEKCKAEQHWARGHYPARPDGTNCWWFAMNHFGASHAAIGLTGLALLGEHRQAKTWVHFAASRLPAFLAMGGVDGGWYEGITYWAFGLTQVLRFLQAHRRVTGDDTLLRHPWLRRTGYWGFYSLYHGRAMVDFCDSGYEVPVASVRPMLFCLAAEFRDAHIQWYAQQGADGAKRGHGAAGLWELLWNEASLAAQPPTDLPLSKHFRGVGWVILRTGWKPDDLLLAFKYGRSSHGGGSHEHEDRNHFVLYAYGERLIVDSGYGLGVPEDVSRYIIGSEGHNTILVEGVGQQTTGPREASKLPIADNWRGFLGTRFYDYVAGDATEAYGDRLEKFVRHLVFVKPDYALVFDDLQAKGQPAWFDSLLHVVGGIEVDDDRIVLKLEPSPPPWQPPTTEPTTRQGIDFRYSPTFYFLEEDDRDFTVRLYKQGWEREGSDGQATLRDPRGEVVASHRFGDLEEEFLFEVAAEGQKGVYQLTCQADWRCFWDVACSLGKVMFETFGKAEMEPHPLHLGLPIVGGKEHTFYFFVPAGTDSFDIGLYGEDAGDYFARLYDPAGELVDSEAWRNTPKAKGGWRRLTAKVRPETAGRLWALNFRGGSHIWDDLFLTLNGLPQVLCAHQESFFPVPGKMEPLGAGWPAEGELATEIPAAARPQLTARVLLPNPFTHTRHRGSQNDGTPIDYIKVRPTERLVACHFLMALFPQRTPEAPLPGAEALTEEGVTGARITLPEATDVVLFRTAEGPFSVNGLESDADVLFVRRQREGVTCFAVQNGSRLRVEGQPLLAAPAKVSLAFRYDRARLVGCVQAGKALRLALYSPRPAGKLRVDGQRAEKPEYDGRRKQLSLELEKGEHEIEVEWSGKRL